MYWKSKDSIVSKMLHLTAILTLLCCANGNFYFDDRIIGGYPVKLGDIPYIVSLRVNNKHLCGGSILNEKFILTAAHCVDRLENDPLSFTVQYGVVDIYSNKNIVNVYKITPHREYSPYAGHINDIAVIELQDKIIFNFGVQPIKLPTSKHRVNAPAILAGWGFRQENNGASQFLQKVNITIYDDVTCKVNLYSYNPKYHICAGDLNGGHGQCNGDSGGPLYSDGVQHGIVSWSIKPCASPNKPGVFTKVVNHLEFIKSVVLDNS